MEVTKQSTRELPRSVFSSDYKIILGDALANLKKIEKEKFDLIISSPPYNVGKEYEVKNSIEKYLENQEKVIKELIRVTSPKGSGKNPSDIWEIVIRNRNKKFYLN